MNTAAAPGHCFGSPRPNIEVVLEALSATHYFQGIVSAEDVHQGKPDPEVYLTAASRVGVSPERCVVVEDYRGPWPPQQSLWA